MGRIYTIQTRELTGLRLFFLLNTKNIGCRRLSLYN
jgi:hypothetical protein